LQTEPATTSPLLIAKIIQVMAILPWSTVAKVCKQLRYWIEAMVEACCDFS
jgi:hypothetical protein